MRNRAMIVYNLPPDLRADITDSPATSDAPYDILLLSGIKKLAEYVYYIKSPRGLDGTRFQRSRRESAPKET